MFHNSRDFKVPRYNSKKSQFALVQASQSQEVLPNQDDFKPRHEIKREAKKNHKDKTKQRAQEARLFSMESEEHSFGIGGGSLNSQQVKSD